MIEIAEPILPIHFITWPILSWSSNGETSDRAPPWPSRLLGPEDWSWRLDLNHGKFQSLEIPSGLSK